MSNLIKIVYSISIDSKTDIFKQIWINEKNDTDGLIKVNFDSPIENYINIIKTVQPELKNFTIKIVSHRSVPYKNYESEIGKADLY